MHRRVGNRLRLHRIACLSGQWRSWSDAGAAVSWRLRLRLRRLRGRRNKHSLGFQSLQLLNFLFLRLQLFELRLGALSCLLVIAIHIAVRSIRYERDLTARSKCENEFHRSDIPTTRIPLQCLKFFLLLFQLLQLELLQFELLQFHLLRFEWIVRVQTVQGERIVGTTEVESH